MKIVTVLNSHGHTECTLDTIESIRTFVGPDILLVVDGLKWEWGRDLDAPVYKLQGFRHGVNKAPYRNIALALRGAVGLWQDYDWLCYTEYDVLFASTRFHRNLELADENGVWMLGNDGHVDDKEIPLVNSLLGRKLKNSYYLLGCCQFFSRKFLDKLVEINFFDKFLHMTGGFEEGHMPGYSGYDVSEHMYPSLCRHFGGNIGVFASYDEMGNWHGAHKYFPLRWRPDLDMTHQDLSEASIMHPIKDFNNPIRVLQREKRNAAK